MRFIRNAVLLGVWVLLSLPAAKATTLEQWDTTRLTRASQWVHVGEVIQKWSAWSPNEKMIYTYVKMRVDQTLKGDEKREILIRVPGGQAQGYGMLVHGVANFAPGERALVFLHQDPDGAPSVVGMTQGKFRIYRNLSTGEDMALFRAPRQVEFYTRGTNGRVRHLVSSQVERRLPLAELIQEIRSAVETEPRVAH